MEKGNEKKTTSQKAIKELKEAIKEYNKKSKPIKTTTMKKFLLISGLMILISFSLFAQDSNKDTEAVLQKFIELKDLQQFLPLNTDGTIRQLYILQDRISFPASTNVQLAGKKIALVNSEELGKISDPYFLQFWDFRISQDKANTGYMLMKKSGNNSMEVARVVAEAEKKGTEWVIIDVQAVKVR
jgi:hypothetical protein